MKEKKYPYRFRANQMVWYNDGLNIFQARIVKRIAETGKYLLNGDAGEFSDSELNTLAQEALLAVPRMSLINKVEMIIIFRVQCPHCGEDFEIDDAETEKEVAIELYEMGWREIEPEDYDFKAVCCSKCVEDPNHN